MLFLGTDTWDHPILIGKNPDTVIFANLSPTITKATPTKYQYSNRGLLKDVLKMRPKAGVITYWDGAYAHVDPAFFPSFTR